MAGLYQVATETQQQGLTLNQVIAVATGMVIAMWGALGAAFGYIRHLTNERDKIRLQQIEDLKATNLKQESIIDKGLEAQKKHTESLELAVQVAVKQQNNIDVLMEERRVGRGR